METSLFDRAEEYLHDTFGDCTLVFTGSYTAGLQRPSSDLDVLVIGADSDSDVLAQIGDVAIDGHALTSESFGGAGVSTTIRNMLLCYPVVIRGNSCAVQARRRALASQLSQDDEGVLRDLVNADVTMGYRFRQFAKQGSLAYRLSEIYALQNSDVGQTLTVRSRSQGPFIKRVRGVVGNLFSDPDVAYAKTLGFLADLAEHRHWAYVSSFLEGAYADTMYSALSDKLYAKSRELRHRIRQRVLAGNL